MRKNDFSPKSTGSSRPLKVGEMLRHALSDILLRNESHIPELEGASITISEVRVSPDLKNATAYFMPLAGSNKEELLQVLKTAAPQLRYLLSKKVDLRYMPRITYRLDESFEEAQRINALLNAPSVKRDVIE